MKRIFDILIFLSILQSCVGIAGEYGYCNTDTISFNTVTHCGGFDPGIACPPISFNQTHTSSVASVQSSARIGIRAQTYGSHGGSHDVHAPVNMTVSELENYFSNDSESEILRKKNRSLLMSDAFVAYIKRFAGYTSYVEHFHEKFHNSCLVKRLMRKALGNRLCHLYREIQFLREAEEAKVRAYNQKQHKIKKRAQQYEHLYASWHDVYAHLVPKSAHATRLAHRIQIYDLMDEPVLYAKDYIILSETKDLLSRYAIDEVQVTHLHGSVIEHTLHHEFVSIACQATTLLSQCNVQKERGLFDSLMQGIDVGTTATQQLQPVLASQAADFCWAVLDLVQAAGEGVILAGYNTAEFVYHISMQPVETVQKVIDGILYIADMLFIINDLPDQLRECDIPNKEYYYQKIAQTEQQLDDLGKAVIQNIKSMKPRDWVKHGVAFGVEGILLHKCIQFTANTCSRLAPLCGNLLRSIEYEEAIAACVDGELISVGRIMPEIECTTTLMQQVEEVAVKSGVCVATELFAAETESLLALLEALETVDSNKVLHILQEHHMWDRICTQYANWDYVKELLVKTIKHGELVMYKGLPSRVLKIGKEHVQIVYIRLKDGLKISNAWVKNG